MTKNGQGMVPGASFLDRPRAVLLRRVLFQVHLWLGIGAGCAAALAAAAAFLLLRRRRRAEELDQELSELLRLPDREVVV